MRHRIEPLQEKTHEQDTNPDPDGGNQPVAKLADAAIVVIDAQNEVRERQAAAPGVDAVEGDHIAARARAPPVHPSCMSMSARRRLFDPDASGGQIAAKVAPFAGEAVIDKRLPNAFAGTDLNDRLAATQRKNLVVVGFMTHLCVSSTVRAALDHGYACTVVAGATGTRDLPAASGESVIPAQVIHEATLASLADRFAVVVQTAADLPD